jgi:DNA-binding protein Fis
VLEDVERRLIAGALRTADWNRTRAAELLGISKETLRYRIEKFDLRPPSGGER